MAHADNKDAVRYYPTLEMLAVESSPLGVIDSNRDIPYAVLWETTVTLHHLAGRYLHTDS